MKIFLFFFLEGKKKMQGWHKKNRVSQLSGNTGIFFLGLKSHYPPDIPSPIGAVVTKDWCITIFSIRKGETPVFSSLTHE